MATARTQQEEFVEEPVRLSTIEEILAFAALPDQVRLIRHEARCGECPWGHRPLLGLVYVGEGEATLFGEAVRIPKKKAAKDRKDGPRGPDGYLLARRLGSRAAVRPPRTIGLGLTVDCARGHVVVITTCSLPDDEGVVYVRSMATTPASSDAGVESRAI